ncbi:carbohydrate binding domain-containing protein [Arthrobacter sedimenti]|uniref:carbohydrate binding domain-containing protein n=1 Tax=Arthrobacter sedimenti TaxID=2694931 RepID=UPI001CDD85A1|nr:carbohydrate binding domain-containing protein [Arthrobacter sedimenti]
MGPLEHRSGRHDGRHREARRGLDVHPPARRSCSCRTRRRHQRFRDRHRRLDGPGHRRVRHRSSDARTGSGSLLVTNRTQPWHGAALDVTAGLPVGTAVEVSVWAKLAPGQAPASLKVSVQRDNGGGRRTTASPVPGHRSRPTAGPSSRAPIRSVQLRTRRRCTSRVRWESTSCWTTSASPHSPRSPSRRMSPD